MLYLLRLFIVILESSLSLVATVLLLSLSPLPHLWVLKFYPSSLPLILTEICRHFMYKVMVKSSVLQPHTWFKFQFLSYSSKISTFSPSSVHIPSPCLVFCPKLLTTLLKCCIFTYSSYLLSVPFDKLYQSRNTYLFCLYLSPSPWNNTWAKILAKWTIEWLNVIIHAKPLSSGFIYFLGLDRMEKRTEFFLFTPTPPQYLNVLPKLD